MTPSVLHVVARGRTGAQVFVDAVDRATYLELLGVVAARHRWRCLAYCLMGNHAHVLVEAERRAARAGARELRRAHERALQLRYGRGDAAWDPPTRRVRVKDDPQLWAVVAYIACNPVEAGLCATPEGWRWSSHRATLGREAAPPWLDVARLLELLGATTGGDVRRKYAEYVRERTRRPR
jgi:putative transposase